MDGKGWTDAGKLTEQDNVLAYGERKLQVEGIWMEELSEPVKVYNFEVEEYHTYYVGEAEVLVHNNNCGQGNEGGLNSIIKNGKVSVDDLKANPSVFNEKSADEIAQALTDVGYDVMIQKSVMSKSGAQIIKINNPGGGKNISQVQVSPGGGRHGENPYVKISTTDQGKIKIVNGPESLYKTDGKETATIIFSGGN